MRCVRSGLGNTTPARIGQDTAKEGTDVSKKSQPTEEELRFLKGMGMTEVEPGRWSSDWQGSDGNTQKWFDDLGPQGEEQLDLLIRAGRVQNEFDLEQSGAGAAAKVQHITDGPLADFVPSTQGAGFAPLEVFTAIKASSVDDFHALDPETIDAALIEMFEKYETLLPPDGIAATLRTLGIKCKAVHVNPTTAGPEEPYPHDYPGYRLVLMHFPGAQKFWWSEEAG